MSEITLYEAQAKKMQGTLNGRTVLNVQGFGTIAADDIGKTAFLSFEEAERALEERKNV